MRLVDRAMLETTWAAAVLWLVWRRRAALDAEPDAPARVLAAAVATRGLRHRSGPRHRRALRTSSDEAAVGSADIGRKSGS
jgi:hypothetical protein